MKGVSYSTEIPTAADRSKAVFPLISVAIDLLVYIPPMVCGALCWSLLWDALLCVISSFAIILTRKRDLVVLLLLFFGCIFTVNVLCFPLMVSCAGLQCVIVVFPDHTHFLHGNVTLC